MNKSDKYYLKEGKLELSILDDDEDEKEQIVQTRGRKDLLQHSKAERGKKRRKVERKVEQPELTVSKDVYNTLHTMGKFLTKPEQEKHTFRTSKELKESVGQKASMESKDSMNFKISMDEQKPKDLKKVQDVSQTMDLEKSKNTEESMDTKGTVDTIEQVLALFDLDAVTNLRQNKQTQEEMAVTQKENKAIYKPLLKEDLVLEDDMTVLKQETIDHLVEAFFEEMDVTLANHPHLEEVKKHILRQIDAVCSGRQKI